MEAELPTAVYIIWWLAIIIVVVAIVPLAVSLLRRTLAGAQSIQGYMEEMLAAGVQIAGHTSAVEALKDTIDTAGTMVGVAGNLKENSGEIVGILGERAAGEAKK